MANIAVQRIKREFKEVLKSEEVRNELPGRPLGGRPLPAAAPVFPGSPRPALLAAALLPAGKQPSPPPSAALPSPPLRSAPLPPGALGWTGSRAGVWLRREGTLWGGQVETGGPRWRGMRPRQSPEGGERAGRAGENPGSGLGEGEGGDWIWRAAPLPGPRPHG